MGVICFLLLLTYFKICRCISIIGSLQKCSVFRALKVQSAGIKKKYVDVFCRNFALLFICWDFVKLSYLSINKNGITCIPCIIYNWNAVFCYHWLSSVKVQANFAFVHPKRAVCTSFLNSCPIHVVVKIWYQIW